MVNQQIIKVTLVKKDGTLRIVIPREIRENLGIKAGDYLVVKQDKLNRITYRKIQNL